MPGRSKWGCATAAIVLLSCTVLYARQSQQLKLVVDRASVRAGERVRLSITPRAVASEFPFAVGFQDGPIEVLEVGQTEIEHEYRNPGTYKISITSQVPIPEVSNNGIAVQVDALRMTAVPPAIKTGETVTFTIDFKAPKDSETKYRFLFGDGSSTAWRNSSTIRFTYESPEVYVARGEVLRPGWTGAITTAPVEISVETGAPDTPHEDQVAASRREIPWILVLAALAVIALIVSVIFVGYKTRQWLFPPRPTFEPHRGGVAGSLEENPPLEVLLEIALMPGIATGRHDLSRLEITRARGERKKNG